MGLLDALANSIEHIPINDTPAPGWIGGFSTSNPVFAYPNPDLSSLPLLSNLDNIPRLTRQVHVLWPEFSWQTTVGDESTRCFQMFAPDISRAGYDDAGRFWAIICPQQAIYSPTFGNLNIEVSVTTQRGWINEAVPASERYVDLLAADMTTGAKVWFSPSSKDKFAYNLLKGLLEIQGLPFPLDKAHAIQINLHKAGDKNSPVLPIRSGLDKSFQPPSFALHYDKAWGAANVAVEIGSILSCNNLIVDEFNRMIMDIFNYAGGNVLLEGNTLSWNVWFDAPMLVDQMEWASHATIWRNSLDTSGLYPDGKPSKPRRADNSFVQPNEDICEMERDKVNAWLKEHVGISFPIMPAPHWGGPAL